eukprot:TCONS_00023692-protein
MGNYTKDHNFERCISFMSILSSESKIFFYIFLIGFGVFGTLLNAYVLYLMVRFEELRKGGNKLFFSMFVADFLVTSFFVVTKLLQMYFSDLCSVNKLEWTFYELGINHYGIIL